MNTKILLAELFLSNGVVAQDNPGPEPCNFTLTEKFCFTNSSHLLDGGSPAPGGGCDYEVCVRVKPKTGCNFNCAMALNPNGYLSETCLTISPGQTSCIDIPVFSHPITDCFTVEFTLKVIGHSETLGVPPGGSGNLVTLEEDYDNIGDEVMYHDNCLDGATWWTVLGRISGPSNEWHFKFWTRGILGE